MPHFLPAGSGEGRFLPEYGSSWTVQPSGLPLRLLGHIDYRCSHSCAAPTGRPAAHRFMALIRPFTFRLSFGMCASLCVHVHLLIPRVFAPYLSFCFSLSLLAAVNCLAASGLPSAAQHLFQIFILSPNFAMIAIAQRCVVSLPALCCCLVARSQPNEAAARKAWSRGRNSKQV